MYKIQLKSQQSDDYTRTLNQYSLNPKEVRKGEREKQNNNIGKLKTSDEKNRPKSNHIHDFMKWKTKT